MNEIMLGIVSNLKDAREKRDEVEARVKQIKEHYATLLDCDADFQSLSKNLNELNEIEAKIAKDLRDTLLVRYEATQEKGVARKDPAWVELNNVVSEYNEGAAKEWCINNMRPALKLDAKKFEAAVISNDVPAGIATASKVPVVKIATKL